MTMATSMSMQNCISLQSSYDTADFHCEPFSGTLEEWGAILQQFPDREIFQTPEWIRYLAESQNGTPAIAVIKRRSEVVGYFAGLTVRKFGVRILGSPFIGWTTERMGLRLYPGVPRRPAVKAVLDYAFHELKCMHMEFADLQVTRDDVTGLGFRTTVYMGSVLDLTIPEEQLYRGFSDKSCRYCIRKATRLGLTVEEASDEGFADDYWRQLQDVFAKQSLVPTYGKDRVLCLMRHLLPSGNLLLLRVREPQGRCVSTGIFLGYHESAYFWGNASCREHQHLCPNELLHWHAMRHWQQRGMKRYDFCGGGHYKRKYGGQPFARLLFRKSKYRVINFARHLASLMFHFHQRLAGQRPLPPQNSAAEES
jgi:hypothetical protein